MRLHTIAKLGGVLSIILFLIGVGMYGFAKLSEAGDGKNVDLLTLVPSDCVRVLETDNLEYFSNEFPRTSYAECFKSFNDTGVVNSILNQILQFSSAGSHRLGNQMNRLMVSFHSPAGMEDVVVYFKMTKESKRLLARIFSEREQVTSPKKESYRGKDIVIFPYRKNHFVAAYSGKGFLAVSYQKRLIERVIDAEKDQTSLRFDEKFSKIHVSKSANFMTIYGRTPAIPFLCDDTKHCWNEYDVHLNSDVFYLSGRMYADQSCLETAKEKMAGMKMKADNNFLIVSGQHQVDSCVSEAIVTPHDALFDECVSTLSREASYIMVADLDQVADDPDKYGSFLPPFVKMNLENFRSFILSVQVTKLQDRLSHILVFTYKN